MNRIPQGTAVDPVLLLWTGGWDSTFRLLQLMHDTQTVVQPVYILDDSRGSIANEIRAMRRIRRGLAERDARFETRILPTLYVSLDQIVPDDQVASMVERLSRHVRVGSQYAYLARYARRLAGALELSMHDREHGLGAAVWPHSDTVDGPYGAVRRLRGDAPAYLDLLRPYSFPLLGWSKREMGDAAAAGGYRDLLELSWFCHRPRGRAACGRCRPCQQVIQGGMTRRMPLSSRLLGRLRYLRRGLLEALLRARPSASGG